MSVTVQVVPHEPTEPGALSGFAVVCSACGGGNWLGSSLQGLAKRLAREHREWHAQREQEHNESVAESVWDDLHSIMGSGVGHLDEVATMEMINSLGTILSTLLRPQDPELAPNYEAVRMGVERFLGDLRDDGEDE